MHYQLSRNGQTYGPYTLDDLQRYLQSGNVLPTDLAKSEEMSDWLPVSQLLSPSTPAPFTAPPTFNETSYTPPAYNVPNLQPQGYADPAYNPANIHPALASSPYPDAPNLNWGLTILFGFLTCGFFTFVWDMVIAGWMRRVQPSARSLYFYLGALGIVVLRWILGLLILGTVMSRNPETFNPRSVGVAAGFSGLLSLATITLIIVANFMKRAELEQHFNGPEPVGLQLSPVLTFFFAPWYFQYHLNRINAIKNAARYGSARAF